MYRPFEALRFAGRLISVIGSGGKTTLLRRLSEDLPGTVVLTTSTHIYPFPGIPLVDTACGDADRARDGLRAALAASRVACVGALQPSGKLASPGQTMPFELMAAMADRVIVEADGAAGHPLKAHRPWEPVIPDGSDLTLCVVGASGIGQPAARACHCPELFCALAGTAPDAPVRAEDVAAALNRERLADVYIVNQVDALPDPKIARRLCDLIWADACPCSLERRR